MKHLAIIADGNRRWAAANNLPVKFGYLQGLTAIERCCGWAIDNKVPHLTVYCFSTENWNRPVAEVNAIMDLARYYFVEQLSWYIERGIRVRFEGRRDRLDADIVDILHKMEVATSMGQYLTLHMCVDYGGRDEISRAVTAGAKTVEEISEAISKTTPDPDAILRTGGKYRLSNFMLWQAAYSELFFSQLMFPALEETDLDSLLLEYRSRIRSYGC